jgi:hypothetical protein
MATNRILVDGAKLLDPNLMLINPVDPHNGAVSPSQLRAVPPAGVIVLGNASERSMPQLRESTEEGTAQSRAGMLNSWKEIASFLNRGIRTVQRWERELQLPVHRIGKGIRSPVFAFTAEIKLWLYANRAKLAAPEQPLEKRPSGKAAQTPAQYRMKASWVRCQQLTEELTRLIREHQLHTLRLAQTLENASLRWAEKGGTSSASAPD